MAKELDINADGRIDDALLHPQATTAELTALAETAPRALSPLDLLYVAAVAPKVTESQAAALRALYPEATFIFEAVVADPADAVAPEVTAFTVGTPTLLTVPITAFTATDNVGVTGYLVTESATPPALGDAGWSGTAPTEYTAASAGSTTLYAWAKDVYNVSSSLSQAVNFPGDVTNPVISVFDLPATASSLTVNISTWTESDDVGVVGWFLSENGSHAAFADPNDAGWLGTEPTDYTFADEGARTLYAAVKDAVGNISAQSSDTCTVTLPVDAAPTVTAFTLPASSPLTVDVTTFTASDDSAVVGYLITESATPPLAGDAGWTGSAPATVTASGAGSITFYPWAKDDAGQVSAVYGSPQTVTVAANTAPLFSVQPTEISKTDTTITLGFTSADVDGDNLLVEYSTDDGATWQTETASQAPGANTATISALSTDGTTPLSATTAYTLKLRLDDGTAAAVVSNSVAVTTGAATFDLDLTATYWGDELGKDTASGGTVTPDTGAGTLEMVTTVTADGAIAYINRPVDKTVNQIRTIEGQWFGGANGNGYRLVDGVPGCTANADYTPVLQIAVVDDNFPQILYKNAAGTSIYWKSGAWSSTPGNVIATGMNGANYNQYIVETHPTSGLRAIIKSGDGLTTYVTTDWVPFASLIAHTDLYLLCGDNLIDYFTVSQRIRRIALSQV